MKSLTDLLNNTTPIPIDKTSRLIFFSDCHRGVNNWSDDFAHNQLIFFHALRYYYENQFTYVEVGDGDELWENRRIQDIRRAHSHVFWMLRNLFLDDRLMLIRGNHNWHDRYYSKDLAQYTGRELGQVEPLFAGIKTHVAIAFQYEDTRRPILVAHGHQGDIMSRYLWRLGAPLVRYLWRPLQLLGVKDPTNPASSMPRQSVVEGNLGSWVQRTGSVLICGHTHKPRFGYPLMRYFNTGSCIHPRCIVGLEIKDGLIELIKWYTNVDDTGRLMIERQALELPMSLEMLCQ